MPDAMLTPRARLLRMARRAVEIVLVAASVAAGVCVALIVLVIVWVWVEGLDDPDQIEDRLVPTSLRVRQIADRGRFWKGCETVTFAVEAGTIDPDAPDPITDGLLWLPR